MNLCFGSMLCVGVPRRDTPGSVVHRRVHRKYFPQLPYTHMFLATFAARKLDSTKVESGVLAGLVARLEARSFRPVVTMTAFWRTEPEK